MATYMKKKEFEDFFRQLNVEEFKHYYETHSVLSCSKYYGVSRNQIYKILNLLNLERHSSGESGKLAQEQRSNTCCERYGVRFVIQSKEIREKVESTNLIRYGAKNVFASEYGKKKLRETWKQNYGVENPWQAEEVKEKIQQTHLERYGVKNPMKAEEVKEKSRQTCLNKYGVEFVSQSDEVKEKFRQTCLDKYGKEHPMQVPEIIEKIDWDACVKKARETGKKNNSFAKSKLEDRIYDRLSIMFDVKRQYSEERYPYFCDFYIPERDMFIEVNGYWTHGFHWYDESSEEDRQLVESWIERDTNFYRSAVDNWTVRDVNKRNTARDNNLNYVVFWNENDVDKWIADGCPDRRDYA